MIVGIGCYGGCANTVIGQCQGHGRACGRFYCAQHNLDRLCYDCGADLSTDLDAEARYPGYCAASRRVATAQQSRRSRQLATVVTGALLAAAMVVALGDIGAPDLPERWATLVAWVLLALFTGTAILWWRARDWEELLRDEYDGEPGFAQFAVTWERQWRDRSTDPQDPRNRERLVRLITTALQNPVRWDEAIPPVESGSAGGTDRLGPQPAS